MVLTILQAHVETEAWGDLQAAFVVANNEMSPDIASTYLVQDRSDPGSWSIVSLWKESAAFDALSEGERTPTDVLVFRAAGAEPERSVYRVSSAAREDAPACALPQFPHLAA